MSKTYLLEHLLVSMAQMLMVKEGFFGMNLLVYLVGGTYLGASG
jgi:hypothetical protein